MEKERLIVEKPTAQVRLIVEEYLSDGKVHSRKDIVEHVKALEKIYNLQTFREGHLAGGIREAITNLDCEKVGRGTFRMKREKTEISNEISIGQRAATACENARQELSAISKMIDYVTADDSELRLLTKIRECVMQLKDFEDVFNNR